MGTELELNGVNGLITIQERNNSMLASGNAQTENKQPTPEFGICKRRVRIRSKLQYLHAEP